MISGKIGDGAQFILKGIIAVLIFFKIRPNHLTFFGFLMSIVVAYFFAVGDFITGGITLIFAGLFDMVGRHGRPQTGRRHPIRCFL